MIFWIDQHPECKAAYYKVKFEGGTERIIKPRKTTRKKTTFNFARRIAESSAENGTHAEIIRTNRNGRSYKLFDTRW